MTAATTQDAKASDPENTITMEVSTGGTVTIGLRPDLAPQHVERIKKLTREGFYDGIVFHRVIDGFMAQTGDPTGTGTGGSKEADLPAEFTNEEYRRGTIGMARSANPNSANSQFFICFTDTGCSFLKSQYTVLGQVTDGMEFIDKVAKGEPPATPDKIVKMQVAADASGAAPAADKAAEAAAPAAEAAPATAAEAPAAEESAPAAEAAGTEPAASGDAAPPAEGDAGAAAEAMPNEMETPAAE